MILTSSMCYTTYSTNLHPLGSELGIAWWIEVLGPRHGRQDFRAISIHGMKYASLGWPFLMFLAPLRES